MTWRGPVGARVMLALFVVTAVYAGWRWQLHPAWPSRGPTFTGARGHDDAASRTALAPTGQREGVLCTIDELASCAAQIIADADRRVAKGTWETPCLAPPGTLILVTVGLSYIHAFSNAMRHLRRCGCLSHVAVLCLDREVALRLGAHGMQCAVVPEPLLPASSQQGAKPEKDALSNIWRVRLRLAQSILAHGRGCLMTDVDALWLQDPWPVLLAEIGEADTGPGAADLVASRGSYPKDVSKRWGAALCMGFIWLRSTHGARQLVSTALSLWDEFPDDQVAMNTALLRFTARPGSVSRWSARPTQASARKSRKPMLYTDSTTVRSRVWACLHAAMSAPKSVVGQAVPVHTVLRPVPMSCHALMPSARSPAHPARLSISPISPISPNSPQPTHPPRPHCTLRPQVTRLRVSLPEVTIRVSFLPHDGFPRICPKPEEGHSTVVVLHCLTDKRGESKVQMMRDRGVWLVDEESRLSGHTESSRQPS